MREKVLSKAEKQFRKRNFAETIRLLEPQVYRFRDNFDFYVLLGSACFHTGDVAGAYSYMMRADQIQSESVPVLLTLAAIHARRGDVEKALDTWLHVLDIDPHNRHARRGLNLLRKGADDERLAELAGTRDLRRLLPVLPPYVPAVAIIALALTAAIAAGVVLVPRIGILQRTERPEISEITLSEREPEFVSHSGEYRYTLTDAEVRDIFESAKNHMVRYRDNLACVELNRLLYSNAKAAVKERVRLLQGHLQRPDFTSMQDSFTFAQVSEDPILHLGCFVVWSGKIANLTYGTNAITFELLVGYQDQRVLEGRATVILEFEELLDDGGALEVLGEVGLRDDAIVVNGISIHRIMPGS